MIGSRGLRRALTCLVGAAITLAAMPGVAQAYWQASDSGDAARATAGLLPAGALPTALREAGRTVQLSFVPAVSSAAAGAVELTSYRIDRYRADAPTGAAPVAVEVCDSGTGPVGECTEKSLPDGNWSFTDTPLLDNWSGAESARSAPVRIDGAAPVITISRPAGGSFSGDRTPVISGGAGVTNGDQPLVTVRIYSGRSASGPPLQLRSIRPEGGRWSIRATPLAGNSSYTITASQADAAGNIGQALTRFVLDTTPPVISLNPLPAIFSATPRLSGSAGTVAASSTSSADAKTVRVLIHAGSKVSGDPIRTLNAVPTGATWTITSPGLPAGRYTAQAQQRDGAGNLSLSAARTFVLDTRPPVVPVRRPPVVTVRQPGENGATDDVTPAVTGTAGTAAGDDRSVTLTVFPGRRVAGSPLQTLVRPAVRGSWTANVAPLKPNRQYTVRVSQRDARGQVGTATATFVVDTVAPLISLSSPATSGAPDFSGRAGTAQRSATSSADTASVTVSIYRGRGAAGVAVQTLIAPVVEGSYHVSSRDLPPGSYSARAGQSDAAGNLGLSQPLSFTVVSPTPPSITITSPSTGATGVGSRPTITGTVAGGGTSSVAGRAVVVRIYRDSAAGANLNQTLLLPVVGAGGAWSVRVHRKLVPGQSYTVVVTLCGEPATATVSARIRFTA